MTQTAQAGGVHWLPWGSEAFLRARAEAKPVLLSIVTPWSNGCREMDRVCFRDEGTAALINDRLVPVRVDADHRPDIADRYDLGGVPTTAFLTPDGRLLGGGTFVPPDRLRAAVARVSEVALPLDASPDAGAAGGPAAPEEGARLRTEAELSALVFDSFDQAHAGFGGAPKFPLVAPVRLALDLHAERQDPALLDIALRTLDAMGWGPLYDEDAGGVFRCAPRADWSGAPSEKLLATNAALLDLFLHAGTLLGNERYFARAVDIVHCINRAFAAANGAWRVSTCADATRQFSDSNASTVSALLHAATVFQDDTLGRHALDALERVLLSSYRPGHGVAHSAAGVRGLLTDQVAMARANLDAWESTGNIVYRMMAEELMHYALRAMWDEADGGFFDRVPDGAAEEIPIRLVPLKPFVLNCDAAVVLGRIAEAVEGAGFAERAHRVLEAMARRAAGFGPLAAHFLLARRAVFR
jgi:hypothetical protein